MQRQFGGTIDLDLVRTSHIGVTRQVLGIAGRASHERKNVFEYKAAQAEPPVQVCERQNALYVEFVHRLGVMVDLGERQFLAQLGAP